MIKIVRIEHPDDELGFWNSGNQNRCELHSQISFISERHLGELFPNWGDDKMLNKQISYEELQNYKFAFVNILQLQIAFTSSELKECIDELGFRIYLLSVDDYFQSPFQVVFRNPLQKEDISSLFV